MALRLIEMVCPEQKREEVEALAREHEPLGVWHDRFMDDQVMVRILLPVGEPLLGHGGVPRPASCGRGGHPPC
jgi:hypothetical protein